MTFLTDKQVEDQLAPEIRELVMPDNSKRPVTMSKFDWENADFLILCDERSWAELVGYAIEETELQNLTFDEAFRCVTAYLANQWGSGS